MTAKAKMAFSKLLFCLSCMFLCIPGFATDQPQFDLKDTNPLALLDLLQRGKEQKMFTVPAPVATWVKKEHLPALIKLLDSKEECMSVALEASSTIRMGSTVGDEAAFLIAGYRAGQYPPALSSKAFTDSERAELIEWARQRFVESTGKDASIDLRARVQKVTAKEVILEFTVENTGRSPLTFYSASMPWGIQGSLTLLAFSDNWKRQQIHRSFYPDDPSPQETTIAAGDSLSGSLDLSRQFPQLITSLRRNSVVLFLDYAPTTSQGEPTSRILKGIVIPKLEARELKARKSGVPHSNGRQ